VPSVFVCSESLNTFGKPQHFDRLSEYALTTIDKIVNWGRSGSMWPMTFGYALPWRASM
jgi:NADH:ubiquinone oxidoreductase subunit B-like Fe-S oxidoreductase